MIKIFFTITIRNLWKDKSGALINILGFSTGLAAFLVILAYLRHETSFEKFHEKADRIFRANLELMIDGKKKHYTFSANILGPRIKELIPEVESYTRMFNSFNMPAYITVGENTFQTGKFFFADSTIFDVFTVTLLKGRAKDALTRKNELLLSESAALLYFGSTDVEGEMIRINNRQDCKVSGVFRDFPPTSHLQPDVLAPFMDAPMTQEISWDGANFFTYLLLHRPSDKAEAERKLQEIYFREMPEYAKAVGMMYYLFPLLKIHLYSNADFEPGPGGDIRQVRIFLAIAVFILLLAVVNYVNLATSKSIERAREVGLRKIMGSYRGQLIWQFLGESALIAAIAMVIAIAIAFSGVSLISEIFQRPVDFEFLLTPPFTALLAGLWLLLSFLAGFYPALVLSMFEPVQVIKGSFRRSQKGILMRKSLVVFQFIISSSIIIGTLIVYRQLNYMQNEDLGYDKEKVMAISLISNFSPQELTNGNIDAESFKKQLSGHSQIESVTVASAYPTHNLGGQLVWGEGMPENDKILMWAWETDTDYLKTLGLELITGNNMNPEKNFRLDLDFIINETAMKQMGWTIESCLGRKIKEGDYRAGACVGVVRDFHLTSLKSRIEPVMFYIGSDMPRNILVRLSGNDVRGTMDFVKEQWRLHMGSALFEYHFLDEQYDALYKNEVNTGRFFFIFALLAIIIACLGLFALSTYETLTRTKEIGIRKALGSSALGIFRLLIANFSLQVLISYMISVPVSWYFMKFWLEGFAYRIPIDPVLFAVSGLMIICVTILTVGFHSLKAAYQNPVISLRYE
jgi:putative ABC transport system permease protein